MANEEKRIDLFEVQHEIIIVRHLVDFLLRGVQATPITKGLLGYKCKQDIIERDKLLLENLIGIQEHLRKLHEMTDGL